MCVGVWVSTCARVFVCVCERESTWEKEREREKLLLLYHIFNIFTMILSKMSKVYMEIFHISS